MKFIFHNINYITLDSVQYGESGSTKIIEKTSKRRRN